MAFQSINPATEAVLATFDEFTAQQTEAALKDADTAFRGWRRASIAERATPMKRAAALLRERKAKYGALITAEMGKPIVAAEAEVEKCAWACEFYADNAERFLAEEPVRTEARASYVAFEPLGVVLAVMPWNFPFWQVFRFAAPTLMAGNSAILKHASNVPQCALAIEEVFRDAGFPSGAFRTLLLSGAAVDALIADPRVRAVSLTGSDLTGEKVAAAAGKALKKTVLELGGSDPFIVLRDADLQAAAGVAVKARFQNAGQSCIAAKRFVVEEQVADEFEQLFAAGIRKLKVGDPADRTVDVGPLARGDLRDALDRQVRDSLARGARVVLGGKPIKGRGYFYEPTLVLNPWPPLASGERERIPVLHEETFGPVAALVRVPDADAAIALANDTQFGLGAALWTRDLDRARELAGRIEAGSVFVNAMVASDPRLPFGGVKRSGYGRELASFGIREFVNIQTVLMAEPSARTAAAKETAGAAVE
ncbi:MAG TPA: NAD-dependent succinate-semialdehyde dehydrogenase [Gemmatimonadales bacterium]|jgi:succinate-semialdehyde dehydrogenase/glutarate-semialdehyde dehydrogenase